MRTKGLIALLFALTFMLSAMLFTIPAFAEDGGLLPDGNDGETGTTLPDTPPAPVLPPVPAEPPTESESAIPEGTGFRPFTPSGTGTVVDNAIDGDGKEFYTIQTEAGNVFYLIIDRQRNSENVYLLNAVTEADLMALAERDGVSISAIPDPPAQPSEPDGSVETPENKPPANNEPKPEGGGIFGMESSTLIFVGIGVAVVGGAGYYFKIVRPKKQLKDDDEGDDYEDDAPDYDDYDNYNDDLGGDE